MNFDFDDQQLELHVTVQRALAEILAFEGHEARGADDRTAWNILTEMGLFGLLVPEVHGGLGLSLVDLALIAEELGARLAPQSILDTLAGTDAIARFGTAQQRAEWLPRLAAGKVRIAIAWHEAGCGYDPAVMSTLAEHGRLNGRKIIVANAANADIYLVPFRVGTSPRVGLALVPAKQAGVIVEASDGLDPSCGHCSVTFSDVEMPERAVLGGSIGRGGADRLFDVMAALQGAAALGLAAHICHGAADYARERIQFDKPIGSFQAIKHRCADMYTQVEAARAAAYYSLCALAEAADDGARAASIAKAFCADVAVRCCQDSIQVHGGMGFTWELGLHHFLRRARVISATFGDGEFHRERVIAATLSTLAPRVAEPVHSVA